MQGVAEAMTDQASTLQSRAVENGDALRQMASRHRFQREQARAAFVSALRVAFGRMCSDFPGLDGVVQGIDVYEASLPEVLDLTESGMFFALLEGTGERMGLLMACPDVMAGLIEAQTTGQVDAEPASPRKPTRTDAALLAPMIDLFLRLAEQRCAALAEETQIAGYAYGSFLDDPRPLGLMLDEIGYRVMKFDVSLGYGAKSGNWILVLPSAQDDPKAAVNGESDETQAAEWEQKLEVVVTESPVVLETILCRVSVSLTEAMRLRPGDMLRVPDTALETLSLESIDCQALGVGRLGQARGQRAIRLTADPGTLRDALGTQPAPCAIQASILPSVQPPELYMPEETGFDQDLSTGSPPADEPTTLQDGPRAEVEADATTSALGASLSPE